jgi:pimeloyl-ACP methyl ester carboxylesterase
VLRARREELTVRPQATVSRLSLGDADLAFEVAGDGLPAVVFVHGALCSRADWKHQHDELSRTFRVVSLDLRGHGASTSESSTCTMEQFGRDVRALVDHLGAAPAVLVGHSMGVRVVLEVAARSPRAVAGLVLVDGSRMFGPSPLAESDRADALSDTEVRRRFVATIEDAIGPRAEAGVREHVSSTMLSAPTHLMRQVLATWQQWDVERYEETLAAIDPSLPVLALQSTFVAAGVPRRSLGRDESTPYLELLRAALPALQVEVLPNVGHFSMLEAPDAVTRSIGSFAGERRGRLTRPG